VLKRYREIKTGLTADIPWNRSRFTFDRERYFRRDHGDRRWLCVVLQHSYHLSHVLFTSKSTNLYVDVAFAAIVEGCEAEGPDILALGREELFEFKWTVENGVAST
jgi:hypothetical protein